MLIQKEDIKIYAQESPVPLDTETIFEEKKNGKRLVRKKDNTNNN